VVRDDLFETNNRKFSNLSNNPYQKKNL